jgi:hypothetical protein
MKQTAIELLEEKLLELFGDHLPFELLDEAKEIEKQQQDEFAIGFADWLILKCDFQQHGVFEYQGNEYTNKELLEIYKKEKTL